MIATWGSISQLQKNLLGHIRMRAINGQWVVMEINGYKNRSLIPCEINGDQRRLLGLDEYISPLIFINPHYPLIALVLIYACTAWTCIEQPATN